MGTLQDYIQAGALSYNFTDDNIDHQSIYKKILDSKSEGIDFNTFDNKLKLKSISHDEFELLQKSIHKY